MALVDMFHSSWGARQLAFISEYTNDVIFIGTIKNQTVDALFRIEK